MSYYIVYFFQILPILCAGIALGWYYCYHFKVKKLKDQNRSMREIEVHEIITSMGSIQARTSEFPLDAEEYLNFHSIERDGGIVEITFEGMETHLDVYACHLLRRQKRDFMKMCKQIKNGDKILAQIGGGS